MMDPRKDFHFPRFTGVSEDRRISRPSGRACERALFHANMLSLWSGMRASLPEVMPPGPHPHRFLRPKREAPSDPASPIDVAPPPRPAIPIPPIGIIAGGEEGIVFEPVHLFQLGIMVGAAGRPETVTGD